MDLGKAVAIALYLKEKGKSTGLELAEKFDISHRTACRLVDKLSTYFPIYTKPGRGGGIYWLKQ